MEKLRWGVLGTARIVRKTIPALQKTKNGVVVGIASRDEERAKACAETHGMMQTFGSYAALLDAPDIDAVYITLPNALHYEWVIRSLEAGKHVLCEKPLALSTAECEDVKRVAEKTGFKVLEGFMYRFHPRFEMLQELLREQVVGELTFINVAHSFAAEDQGNIRWSSGLGGGALFDVGCYCVNLSRTLAGAEPLELSAFANYVDANDGGRVDSSFAGMLRFPAGVTAHFDCGMNLERRNHLEIVGTQGRLVVDNPFSSLEEDSVIEEHHFGQDSVTHEIGGANHFTRMGEAFAEAVLNGTPLRYGLDDAAGNAQTLEALAEAARRADAQELDVQLGSQELGL